MKSVIRFFGLAIVLTIAITGSVIADAHIKQVTTTDAVTIMGQTQPEQHDTLDMWFGDNMATISLDKNMMFIIRADRGFGFLINHSQKTYSVIPMELKALAKQAVGKSGEEVDNEITDSLMEMAQQMIGKPEVTVTPTDEHKEIGDYNARKYLMKMKVAMMSVDVEVWATEEIKLDYDLYNAANNAMMSLMPGFEDILKEMQKIEGMTIYSRSETEVMGNKMGSTVELIHYEEGTAPDGIYEEPKNYKRVEVSSMTGMH